MLVDVLGRSDHGVQTNLERINSQAAARLREIIDAFNADMSSDASRL